MPKHTTDTKRFAKHLGRAIRAARIASAHKVESLALACNITQASLSEIELGQNFPSMITLVRIAVELDFPLWQIIKAAETSVKREEESA